MINLIIALKAEAKPLLGALALKQIAHQPFAVYQNTNHQLIISGPGKNNAAAATTHLSAHSANDHRCWVNIGVGGHASLAQGTPVHAGSVIDAAQGVRYKLDPPIQNGNRILDVITVDEPEYFYPRNAVYDMEAAGIVTVAQRFSTAKCIHVIKIISDNKSHSARQLKAVDLTRLVASALPYLLTLNTQLALP